VYIASIVLKKNFITLLMTQIHMQPFYEAFMDVVASLCKVKNQDQFFSIRFVLTLSKALMHQKHFQIINQAASIKNKYFLRIKHAYNIVYNCGIF